MAEGNKKANINFWYWIIGTLVVLGLIWWWASAAIEEEDDAYDATPEEVGVDDEESAFLENESGLKPDVLFIHDFPRG